MQLFGSLCHELRTPLNCSISFLDLYRQLKEGSQEESEVKEFIEPSLRSNQLMLNMVNDILDFVQMTDNKFKFTPLQFDLNEMIEECLMLIKIHADVKNISLSMKKNDLVPKFIVSDPNRVRQIILNFLSNALKFTKAFGKISIELNGLDTTVDNNTNFSSVIRVSVQDTGVGISKQNIKKIFEIFNKTEHKDSQLNPNGCGIGLPLSNSLAKLIGPQQPILINHSSGGQIHLSSGIQVESIEGKGSTFSFLIQDMNKKQKQDKQEKDIHESCNLSEMGDFVIEQGQSYIENNKWKSFNSNLNLQQIPHLKIKQEVVGGLQINSFQQDQIDQQHYLQESVDNRKTIQSSGLRSSNKTDSNSGNLDRISSTFNPKQKRITDGIMKTKTITSETIENFPNSKATQQPLNSIPKIQSLQVFTFPNSSNFVPFETSGQQSPLNTILKPQMSHKFNQIQQDLKNELKNIQINSNNNQNSHSQIKNISSTSIYSQITNNTQDIDVQVLQPSYQYQHYTQIQQLTQITQQNQQISQQIQQIGKNPYIQQQNPNIPQITQQPHQISSQAQTTQQAQIQKNLLDKNNFSYNSKGEETKILIADDSGFNVMVLKKIIQLFHIQNIHICHDGQEAVQKIRYILNEKNERLYDIIFMDLDMPIMNGYEACKQIKQMIINYEVPETLYVVACSAYGMQVKEEHTYHISQMDDAIVKPVKKDQVLNIFQTYLRDKPKAQNV